MQCWDVNLNLALAMLLELHIWGRNCGTSVICCSCKQVLHCSASVHGASWLCHLLGDVKAGKCSGIWNLCESSGCDLNDLKWCDLNTVPFLWQGKRAVAEMRKQKGIVLQTGVVTFHAGETLFRLEEGSCSEPCNADYLHAGDVFAPSAPLLLCTRGWVQRTKCEDMTVGRNRSSDAGL